MRYSKTKNPRVMVEEQRWVLLELPKVAVEVDGRIEFLTRKSYSDLKSVTYS